MGEMHANCYKHIPDVTVSAVADIRPEKAAQIAQGTDAKIYADGKDLIADAQVDIIDICLPTFLHAEYALLAMDKVSYLMVEKPVALTVAEADAMLAKSRQTGCHVQVGQVIRFWDEYVALRAMVEQNRYGKVVNANFHRISPSPAWGWMAWLRKPAFCGGAAQDLHIHDVDFVLSLFGQPEKLYAVKNTLGESNSYINTLMQYTDFVVSVEGTWGLPECYPFGASFRVVFENATVENSGGKFMLYTADGSQEILLEKCKVAAEESTQGNIAELGGYYNELLYLTGQAAASAPITQASLADAAESLHFLLEKELAFCQ